MQHLGLSDKTITLDVDLIYPVGSIYLSVNSTSPATLFGGTWTQLIGSFLYMSTSSLTTGGASSHAHSTNATTLAINQMPSHNHAGTTLWTQKSSYGHINVGATSGANRADIE
jgi:hypothetical protein